MAKEVKQNGFKGVRGYMQDAWAASASPLFDKEKHPIVTTLAEDFLYKRDYSKNHIEDAIDKLTLQGETEKAAAIKQKFENGDFNGKFKIGTAISKLTLTAAFAPAVLPAYAAWKVGSFVWNGNAKPVIEYPNDGNNPTGDTPTENDPNSDNPTSNDDSEGAENDQNDDNPNPAPTPETPPSRTSGVPAIRLGGGMAP